jgi:hypothetical protein
MVLRWSTFKIMSCDPDLHPRWLPSANILRKFFKFQPIRTHYGPWQPCWISNQHQKQKSGRGPSSEHFWQVWLKSVQWFCTIVKQTGLKNAKQVCCVCVCFMFVCLSVLYLFSSPGHRPCELLSWVSVRRPSVRLLALIRT